MNKLLTTLIVGLATVGAGAQAPAPDQTAPTAIHKTTTLADVKFEMKETQAAKKAQHHAHKSHHQARAKTDPAVGEKTAAEKK